MNKLKKFPSLLFIGALFAFISAPSVLSAEDSSVDDEQIDRIVSEAQGLARTIIERISSSSERDTFMGVTLESVPSVLREYIDLPKGVGLLMPHISKGGPAEKAGVLPNDILLQFDGQLIVNVRQLTTLIDLKEPGDEVEVVILRKGEEKKLKIELAERKKKLGFRKQTPGAPSVPDVPHAPHAPHQDAIVSEEIIAQVLEGADEVSSVISTIEEWIPGSVRVMLDENEQWQVDLQGLKENMRDLETKILKIKETDGAWEDITMEYGDAGARKTVIRMAENNMNYSSENGKVLLKSAGDVAHVRVWDKAGDLLYDGPKDDSENIPDGAVILIEEMEDARSKINIDSSESSEISIELSADDSEPVTLISPKR